MLVPFVGIFGCLTIKGPNDREGVANRGDGIEGCSQISFVFPAGSCLAVTAQPIAQNHGSIKQLLSLRAAHLSDFSKQALTTLGAELPVYCLLFFKA